MKLKELITRFVFEPTEIPCPNCGMGVLYRVGTFYTCPECLKNFIAAGCVSGEGREKEKKEKEGA